MKITLLFIVLLVTLNIKAQWSTDPNVNNPISTATGNQWQSNVISDGNGGAIICWEDYNGTNIYAQRINASGIVQWTTNGIAICSAPNFQSLPDIVSDGNGGAIITWRDHRSGTNHSIYAQRVNASGSVQWATNGVAICNSATPQYGPQIISDSNGGAIIAWVDNRNLAGDDVFVQKINSNGIVQWTLNGVPVCTEVSSQEFPELTTDGNGGAILTWGDRRNGRRDVYSQKIDSSGITIWSSNGIKIDTLSNTSDMVFPQILNIGEGSAVMAWARRGVSGGINIYAQLVDSNGIIQWPINGLAVCTAANIQDGPMLAPDGKNGVFISWYDYRNAGGADIYAQRISSEGINKWMTNGINICSEVNDQTTPNIISDDNNGAIITWLDRRTGGYQDIYAQKLDSTGNTSWNTNGNPICTNTADQSKISITTDGAGGAIIVWDDLRNGSGNSDIYTSLVGTNGSLGTVTGIIEQPETFSNFEMSQNFPNPFNPSTVIKYQSPVSGQVIIKVYDLLGKEVTTLVNEDKPAGTYKLTWNAADLPSGVYFYQLKATPGGGQAGNYVETKKMLFLK